MIKLRWYTSDGLTFPHDELFYIKDLFISTKMRTVHFWDMDKLNFVMVVWFMSRANFLNRSNCLNIGQKWLKINHLALSF